MFMRILNKNNSINEIVDTIITMSKYQKVVLCMDEHSDTDFIETLTNKIDKSVILLKYYYNKNNVSAFHNMINNGARIVVYDVSIEHFYKLQNDNNYILNIFLPQSNFVLPYITNGDSVFGDNLLICDTNVKDYTTLIFMYELALDKIWNLIIQEVDVDTAIFKNIDMIANGKCDFYQGVLNQIPYLKTGLTEEYKEIKQEQLPYYAYLRLCATLKMLENLNQNKEQYVDFYKTELSTQLIDKAHDLIIKYDIVQILKSCSENLIKLNVAVLNRIKTLIKKYFNFKNIKLNKLNKTIKNQAKYLKIDDLLYISYIFNSI